MGAINRIKTPDGTIHQINDNRIPTCTPSDAGKILTAAPQGNYVLADVGTPQLPDINLIGSDIFAVPPLIEVNFNQDYELMRPYKIYRLDCSTTIWTIQVNSFVERECYLLLINHVSRASATITVNFKGLLFNGQSCNEQWLTRQSFTIAANRALEFCIKYPKVTPTIAILTQSAALTNFSY